jgi:hypothetical protein
MHVLTPMVFVLAMTAAAGLAAQEQDDASMARGARKAVCEQEARMIYRTSSRGTGMAADIRERMIQARKNHVRDCLARVGSAPG